MRTLIHGLRVLTGLDAPATQLTPGERTVLAELARHADVIVEIGTFEGATACELAGVSPGRVFSIDLFTGGRLGISYGEVIARTWRRRRNLSNLEFIRGDSRDVAGQFDLGIDLLFIDADHSYDGVKADWNAWTPKVRSGGTIAMHDSRVAVSSPVRLGSMDFYDEVRSYPGVDELPGVDSLGLLRKR